jgi:hypothetical protein
VWSKSASITTHWNQSEEDLLIKFVTMIASRPKDKHGLSDGFTLKSDGYSHQLA